MRAGRVVAAIATGAALSASIVLSPAGPAGALPPEPDCSTARAQTATAWAIYQTYAALVAYDLSTHRNTTSDANNAYHWHGVWEANAEASQSC